MRHFKRKDTFKFQNFVLSPHAAERFDTRTPLDDLFPIVANCIEGFESYGNIVLYSGGIELRGVWKEDEQLFIIHTLIACPKDRFYKHRRHFITKENLKSQERQRGTSLCK